MLAFVLLAQLAAPAALPAPVRRESQAGGTQTLSDIAGRLDARRKAGLGKPAFFSAAESTAPRAAYVPLPVEPAETDTLGPVTASVASAYGVNWWQYGYGGGTRTVIVHEHGHGTSPGHGPGHASGGHARKH